MGGQNRPPDAQVLSRTAPLPVEPKHPCHCGRPDQAEHETFLPRVCRATRPAEIPAQQFPGVDVERDNQRVVDLVASPLPQASRVYFPLRNFDKGSQ